MFIEDIILAEDAHDLFFEIRDLWLRSRDVLGFDD
jgi:hypothetical protein